MMLKLEFPNEMHREMYENMKKTWKNFDVSRVSARMLEYDSYDEFVEFVEWDKKWRPDRVPSTFFFSIIDDEIVGHIQIRHHIEHPNLRDVGWHIGYGIVPWKWLKGYGKTQLALALEKAKDIGLEKVMISCLEDNIASAKVIEANWGELERVRILDNPPEDMQEEKWKNLKIYWINIK